MTVVEKSGTQTKMEMPESRMSAKVVIGGTNDEWTSYNDIEESRMSADDGSENEGANDGMDQWTNNGKTQFWSKTKLKDIKPKRGTERQLSSALKPDWRSVMELIKGVFQL